MTDSTRWYWCGGCGMWHDMDNQQEVHHLMLTTFTEPNERNFDGTAEELRRFRAWRAIKKADAEEARRLREQRIDEALG